MADSLIAQYLKNILKAVYGKDVRQSIHDAIKQCYYDGKTGAVDLIARQQIANLVANDESSEGNSELIDIRVGTDGKNYPTAGEAVRGQVSNLEEIVKRKEDKSSIEVPYSDTDWMNGNFNYTNESLVLFNSSATRITTKNINVATSKKIKVECNSGYKYRVLFFPEIEAIKNGTHYTIISSEYDDYSTWHDETRILSIPEDAKGYAVCLSKNDDSNITAFECTNISVYEMTGNFLGEISEKYSGKILSILGDSISTYSGYIPAGNRSRYPEGDVDSVDKTYWKKIIDALGMKLGVNESWAGSLVSWDGTTESNDIGENKHIASLTRISHLGDNGTPDIILIFAGTNDIGHDIELGSYDTPDFEQDIDLLPVSTFSDAYMTMIIRVQYYYPESKILVLTPSFAKYTSYTGYTLDRLNQYINKIIEVCEIMGVDVIDTRKIGFSMYNIDDLTIDGLHPNAKGMDIIYSKIRDKILFDF